MRTDFFLPFYSNFYVKMVHIPVGDVSLMFTLEEKKYLLQLLKKEKRKRWFRSSSETNRRLIEKLEQMIRNEEVNARQMNRHL